jgi:hypothetical protein
MTSVLNVPERWPLTVKKVPEAVVKSAWVWSAFKNGNVILAGSKVKPVLDGVTM